MSETVPSPAAPSHDVEPVVPTALPAAEPVAEPAPAPAEAAQAPAQAPAPSMDPAACARLLKERFPGLFGGTPKPLKLRIQADIQQRAPGVFPKAALSAFLRRLTGSTAYLNALSRATHRFDLDGQPADALSDEHRQIAQEELSRRRKLHDERRAQEEAGRRDRLNLLRDFERTTLTLANFCALKGLSPEALEETLAVARREAAEVPPPAARPEGGRPGPRRDGAPGGRRDDRRGEGRGEPRRPQGPRQDGARPPRARDAQGPSEGGPKSSRNRG